MKPYIVTFMCEYTEYNPYTAGTECVTAESAICVPAKSKAHAIRVAKAVHPRGWAFKTEGPVE